MRKKAEIKNERTKDAVERNPKRGPTTAEMRAKRAGGQLTGPSRVPAAAESVGRKGKAKPRKPKQEPRYVLVLQTKGDEDFDEALTKGEMLAMLAQDLIDEDTGEVDETGDVGKFKMPDTLAGCADLLYTARQRRLKHDHASKAIKLQEKALREHLIDNLPKSSATGAAGHVARAQIEIEDTPVVEDWDAVRAHIKKTGSFDLLNKALNRKAVKERWNAGKQVPGVGHFQAVKVSLNKI